MALKRMVLELGMGTDLQGEDYTKAAIRALKAALWQNSLSIADAFGLERTSMHVKIIIGVQKAIGAKSTFILTQFLFEAVALCLFGALFALLAIEAIVLLVNTLDVGIELKVRPSRIVIALSVAVASGLLAGLAPARKAARMEPVEAMRTNA